MNKNNKNEGIVEFLIYPEEDKYVGACLTFDIIEEDKDYNTLKKSLEEAAILHIKTVKNKNLSEALLNRSAPKEYWDKYEELKEKALNKDFQEYIKNKKSVSRFFSTYQDGLLPSFACAC